MVVTELAAAEAAEVVVLPQLVLHLLLSLVLVVAAVVVPLVMDLKLVTKMVNQTDQPMLYKTYLVSSLDLVTTAATLSVLEVAEAVVVEALASVLASVVVAEVETVPTLVEMVLVVKEDNLLLRIVDLVQRQQLHHRATLAMVVLYQ